MTPAGPARWRDVHGILLLDKPPGISSNDALQRVKRLFQARKAGHTGNLDVPATGLLPICLGEGTKVCAFLLDAGKTYESVFRFGARTTTGDAAGEIVETASTEGLTRSAVQAAMRELTGEILQVPPMHSAIKHQGQPLYKLAHKGMTIERTARPVTVHRFELLGFDGREARVRVTCSKGTYIRTLAEDLGGRLGCLAHVAELRRTGVGTYRIEDAWTPEALTRIAEDGLGALDACLLGIDSALAEQPEVALSDDASYYLRQGQAVQVPHAPTGGLVRIYSRGREFLGIGEVLDDGRVAPRRLLRT